MARRFHLPPLDLIQGFEAAARNLSFTKAAEELLLTQSAISRQIRGLEEHLGVPLFERRARAIALTEQGQVLNRAVSELLERLQQVTDALRSDGGQRHLTVTTTSGFASLWLIPRLRRFTQLYPDVDVRISATYKTINLERSLVDVAVRYCRSDGAPEGGQAFIRRGTVPRLQPTAHQRRGASLAHAGRPSPPRLAAHRRSQRLFGLGDLARSPGADGLQTGRVLALRQLRANDCRGACRPGRGHGHQQPGEQVAGGGAIDRPVQQKRDRHALLLCHLLGQHRRAPAR
jgi:DNA-binding transcriptional LysR family regulator